MLLRPVIQKASLPLRYIYLYFSISIDILDELDEAMLKINSLETKDKETEVKYSIIMQYFIL